MSLPKLNTPIYEIELPSNKKSIRYRPFLVKEEKIMIIANESNDPKQITMAVRQVLTNCVLEKDLNIDNLSTFDLEFLFLNMYRRSVDDNFNLRLLCPDDGETEVDIKLNVNDIKVERNPDHTDTFKIGDDLIIKMKYPTFKHFIDNNFDYSKLTDEDGELVDTESKLEQMDQTFRLISGCIDTITSNDGTSYSASDCTEEELNDFVESLNQSAFQAINTFFDTMPKLRHKLKFTNKVTKVKCEVVLEGLADFFD
jgi:hypothetical protein